MGPRRCLPQAEGAPPAIEARSWPIWRRTSVSLPDQRSNVEEGPLPSTPRSRPGRAASPQRFCPAKMQAAGRERRSCMISSGPLPFRPSVTEPGVPGSPPSVLRGGPRSGPPPAPDAPRGVVSASPAPARFLNIATRPPRPADRFGNSFLLLLPCWWSTAAAGIAAKAPPNLLQIVCFLIGRRGHARRRVDLNDIATAISCAGF